MVNNKSDFSESERTETAATLIKVAHAPNLGLVSFSRSSQLGHYHVCNSYLTNLILIWNWINADSQEPYLHIPSIWCLSPCLHTNWSFWAFSKTVPLLDIPHYYILFTEGQKDYSRLMHFIWTLHLCKPSHLSKQSPVKAKLPNLQPDGFPTQHKVENYCLSWARSLLSPSLASLPLAWLRGGGGVISSLFLGWWKRWYVKQEWLY